MSDKLGTLPPEPEVDEILIPRNHREWDEGTASDAIEMIEATLAVKQAAIDTCDLAIERAERRKAKVEKLYDNRVRQIATPLVRWFRENKPAGETQNLQLAGGGVGYAKGSLRIVVDDSDALLADLEKKGLDALIKREPAPGEVKKYLKRTGEQFKGTRLVEDPEFYWVRNADGMGYLSLAELMRSMPAEGEAIDDEPDAQQDAPVEPEKVESSPEPEASVEPEAPEPDAPREDAASDRARAKAANAEEAPVTGPGLEACRTCGTVKQLETTGNCLKCDQAAGKAAERAAKKEAADKQRAAEAAEKKRVADEAKKKLAAEPSPWPQSWNDIVRDDLMKALGGAFEKADMPRSERADYAAKVFGKKVASLKMSDDQLRQLLWAIEQKVGASVIDGAEPDPPAEVSEEPAAEEAKAEEPAETKKPAEAAQPAKPEVTHNDDGSVDVDLSESFDYQKYGKRCAEIIVQCNKVPADSKHHAAAKEMKDRVIKMKAWILDRKRVAARQKTGIPELEEKVASWLAPEAD